MNVAVVDYGIGNQKSVCHALANVGAEPRLVRTPEDVLAAERLVLPGVGAAGTAMRRLRADGLDEALTEAVRRRGTPLLGICLGMQLLAERLHECGSQDGFGWIAGEVVDLHDVPGHIGCVPHMGWSSVEIGEGAAELFRGVRAKREFYFCHSYTLRTPNNGVVAAVVDDGIPLVAAVLDGTVFATQFHPEKSQINGLRLIETFLEWSP